MNRKFGAIRKPAHQALFGGLLILATAGCATPAVMPATTALHLDLEAKPLTFDASAVVTQPRPERWARSTDSASLWSAPESSARLFGDLPAGTLVQLQGSPSNGRTPVYFFGDGLSRQPGAAWVDTRVLTGVQSPTADEQVRIDSVRNGASVPGWVQNHKATTLWSGPDEKAVSLTDLPQWSYLHLSGVQRGGRVLVEYSGDYASRQKGIGWVEQSAVGPSANPGEWVQNVRGSALFAGKDAAATKFTDLPAGAKLRVVDPSAEAGDRTLVEFFGDAQGRQPGQAWIPTADVKSILPPSPLPTTKAPASATAGKVESYSFASEADFIKTVGDAARRSQEKTRVPASVTVAQAILESNWGKSKLTKQANNLFGIKAQGTLGSAGSVTMPTWEHINGQDVTVDAPFRAYFTLIESIDDHAKFLQGPRYRPAMAVASDSNAFARAIHAAGYATDPSYSDKLIKLMEKYDLYRFDVKA